VSNHEKRKYKFYKEFLLYNFFICNIYNLRGEPQFDDSKFDFGRFLGLFLVKTAGTLMAASFQRFWVFFNQRFFYCLNRSNPYGV
jgi:hypothetical protein